MQNKKELALNIIIIFLLFFSYYSTLIVGLSWDETFHYLNGKVRFEYLKTFGKFKNYNYSNNIYYPGLYDTITYFAGSLILFIMFMLALNRYEQEEKDTEETNS